MTRRERRCFSYLLFIHAFHEASGDAKPTRDQGGRGGTLVRSPGRGTASPDDLHRTRRGNEGFVSRHRASAS